MGTLRGTETSCHLALYFNPYLRQRFQAFQLSLQEPSCWTPSRRATPVGRPRSALPLGLFSSQIRSGLAKPSRVPLGEQQPVLAVDLGCRRGWRCFSSCRVWGLLFLPFYFFFLKKKGSRSSCVILHAERKHRVPEARAQRHAQEEIGQEPAPRLPSAPDMNSPTRKPRPAVLFFPAHFPIPCGSRGGEAAGVQRGCWL